VRRFGDFMSELYQIIKKAVDQVRIIDTHEHLIQETQRTAGKPDLFQTFFSHYASSDLVSSGMSLEELEEVRDSKLPLEKRWEIVNPFWERIQYTGYGRAIDIAARDLYGVDGITADTYREFASRMEEANRPGLYQWILKEKSGIDVSILDQPSSAPVALEEVDRTFFASVARFDDLVMARERRDFETLGKRCGKPIHSFSDLIQVLELEFENASKMIVGVKIGLAYLRNIRFDKVSQSEAEEVFVQVYNQELFRSDPIQMPQPAGLSLGETKPLQDFMVHKIIQLAEAKRLPIQIHTGLQEGNENIITNSNPTLLTNLFREYNEVRFDVFHGSYPYTGELAALAKNFQNVYIDMCWHHIISPYGARQALAEWLDTVPWNKIFGFGGDYIFAEGVYGHSVIARENIARVLTEKVKEGIFSEEKAIYLAQKLLRDNAYEFFFSEKTP